MSVELESHSAPSGRLLAIGDIHGCAEELNVLLKAVAPGPGDRLVFVGDYVDRGPASREVISTLLETAKGPQQTIFLKGNHEDMLLSFLGLGGNYGESFLLNGGMETMQSYGIGSNDFEHVRELLPVDHLEFFQALRNYYLEEPFLFVHAGVMPLRSLEEQYAEDLLWIRQEFILHPHVLGHTVVFGHTPVREILLDFPYKIGIDTGLVYGGKLTCLELPSLRCYQVARGARQAKVRQLKANG